MRLPSADTTTPWGEPAISTERVIASVGGKVESYYFALGSDDFYLIADLPDHAAAAAATLSGSASGSIRIRTTVLITPEEVDAAAKLSADYRAPGA